MDEAEWTLEMYKIDAAVVRELGNFALQALITINAGAIITLLTFIPKIIGGDHLHIDVKNIKLALFAFLAGLFMAFLCIMITYIFVQIGDDVQVLGFWGWLTSILGPAVFSFIFFAAGVVTAIFSVQEK